MQTKKIRSIQKQRGFGLIETSLAILLIMSIAIQAFSRQMEEARDLAVINQGKSVASIAANLNNTLGEFYGAWVGSLPGVSMPITLSDGTIVDIADPAKPTIAELTKLGYFPKNFQSTAFNGGGYSILVNKVPENCVTPSCNLEAFVCLEKPIRKAGNVGHIDFSRLGLAVKTMGPDAGGSMPEHPDVISGLGGKWVIPNNVSSPANQAGILCMRAGYGSSAWAAFFRIDGSRWMKADANMGGNSVVNAKQLVTILKAIDQPCDAPGAIAGGKDSSGSEVSMICRAGKWKVQTGNMGNPGDPCSPDGSRATSNATGEDLVCKKGRYVRLVNLIPQNIQVGRINVVDGQNVPKPSCDVGGLPDYLLTINKVAVDVTVAPPYQAQYVTTIDNGASWTVVLRVRTDTGSERSGNVYSLSAIMNLECKY